MNAADYAKGLGVKSQWVVFRGMPRGMEDSLGYCTYDERNNRFAIFEKTDDPVTELHELGHVKSHENGYPLFARTLQTEESKEDAEIFDETSLYVQNMFQHPHVYSLVAGFMSPSDWRHDFDGYLSLFERGVQYYGSVDIKGYERLAGFAVAGLSIQLVEVLLSTQRHSPGQVPRARACMERVKGLSKRGLALPKHFWEHSIGILDPYYSVTPFEDPRRLHDDIMGITGMILPPDVGLRFLRGPDGIAFKKVRTHPEVEIPVWIADYHHK